MYNYTYCISIPKDNAYDIYNGNWGKTGLNKFYSRLFAGALLLATHI